MNKNSSYLSSFLLFTILVYFVFPDFVSNSSLSLGSSSRGTFLCSNVSLDTRREEEWSLELCTDSLIGSHSQSFIGYFILRTLLVCNEGDSIISFDKETADEVRRSIGPHEFFTLIEGVETIWLAQEYLGHCVYRFPFRLSIPSPRHRLHLVQMRKDYWGFNEVNSSLFPQVDISVIANQVFFTLPWPISQISDTKILEDCVSNPKSSRFVLTETSADIFDYTPLSLSQSDLPLTNFYVDLRSSISTRWDSYDCKIPQTTPQSFVECGSGLKIDFIGDSHLRVLFNHLLRIFCGVPQAAQKGWGVSQCIRFGEMPLCPLLSACLIYSPYLDFTGDEGHGSDRDALVLNFGNHPAGAAHWTLKQFSARIHETFMKISSFKYTKKIRQNVFWLGQSPIPLRTDDYVRSYADARTSSRMMLFERTAVTLSKPFVENGTIGYIDIFALGMTAIQWSFDRAHLTGVDAALDGIVDVLLLQICIRK